MRSDEAAAAFLSKGQTNDLKLATILDQSDEAHIIKPKTELQMDAELRGKIRDALGFDFTVTINPRNVTLQSTEEPFVNARALMYDGDIEDGLLTNEDALQRVFAAIDRLKAKWDKAISQDVVKSNHELS